MINKIAVLIVLLLLTGSATAARFGASARVVTQLPDRTLVDCSYGRYGNNVGNIGTYRYGNGATSTVFYGDENCDE